MNNSVFLVYTTVWDGEMDYSDSSYTELLIKNNNLEFFKIVEVEMNKWESVIMYC